MMDQTPKYLRRKASTEYLLRVWGIEIAPSTLAKKCSRRAGPATVHCGRVALHSCEALDAFARAQLKVRPALDVTLASTAPLPPIVSAAGEWRAAA